MEDNGTYRWAPEDRVVPKKPPKKPIDPAKLDEYLKDLPVVRLHTSEGYRIS